MHEKLHLALIQSGELVMDYMQKYSDWLNDPLLDPSDIQELESIADNREEIEDRFYQDLEFGTAGLRGKIGVGTNRMNKYIIMKVTQGLANFINTFGEEEASRGVAIAYDCRHFSVEFSETAASVLAGNGIKVYLFEGLRPTPELSFAVRHFNAQSGIVVTASHNPKDYNGYKVYWDDGAQILDDVAKPLMAGIADISSLSQVKSVEFEEGKKSGLIRIIGEEIDKIYIDKVKTLTLRDSNINKNISVVYTPLNGTGNIPVRRVLSERGFTNIHVVPEQENPDGDFTTVGYPNPEDTKAFAYAEKLGKKLDAKLLMATDPDCDRLAIMVRDNNDHYVALNGNQTGALLIHYLLSGLKEQNRLPENGAIIKSIVTGDFGRDIARDFGVETVEVLTGFKNICGKINEFNETGSFTYLFGYEESIGYNAAEFVRDKDAVMAAMLLVEMAAYWDQRGKSLLDLMDDLFQKHGYYKEKLISLVREGISGKKLIDKMMSGYRNSYPQSLGKSALVSYTDYQNSITHDFKNNRETVVNDIPKSNVLRFFFDDGSWYALRPSGTEPKIKLYMYSKAETEEEATLKLEDMEKVVFAKLESFEE